MKKSRQQAFSVSLAVYAFCPLAVHLLHTPANFSQQGNPMAALSGFPGRDAPCRMATCTAGLWLVLDLHLHASGACPLNQQRQACACMISMHACMHWIQLHASAGRTTLLRPSSRSTLLPSTTNGKFSGSLGLACAGKTRGAHTLHVVLHTLHVVLHTHAQQRFVCVCFQLLDRNTLQVHGKAGWGKSAVSLA